MISECTSVDPRGGIQKYDSNDARNFRGTIIDLFQYYRLRLCIYSLDWYTSSDPNVKKVMGADGMSRVHVQMH
jgi:hypothetical protein